MANSEGLDLRICVRYNNIMFVLRTLSGRIITPNPRKVKRCPPHARVKGEISVIRRMEARDLEAVASIWLASNLEAHSFIPAEYWRGNYEAVKAALAQAEVYVYEDAAGVLGFVGLSGDYVEGIFVASDARSHGIGRQLLDHVKATHRCLELNVYAKNRRAVEFYQREGFELKGSGVDPHTREEVFLFFWRDE